MTKSNTAAPTRSSRSAAFLVIIGTSGSHDYLNDRTAGQRLWLIDPDLSKRAAHLRKINQLICEAWNRGQQRKAGGSAT